MAPKRRGGPKRFGQDRSRRKNPDGSTEKPAEYKPRPQYPEASIPKLVSLRNTEKEQIEIFRRLRKAFQDGPLYTVLEAGQTNAGTATAGGLSSSTNNLSSGGRRGGMAGALPGTRPALASSKGTTRDIDPFESLPTYSQKYKKPRRPIPQLRACEYNKDFFPPELHQYIDSSGPTASMVSNNARVAAARSKLTAAEEEELFEQQQVVEEEEEDAIMEEEDDDFEEDEDDDDDYNAENYFSDGKSDGGGAGDDGGGDEY